MSIDTFNRMFGKDEGYFNGYFSNEALDLNRRYLASDYTPADADKIANQLEDSYGDIMNVVTWLSIPIFIIVIYELESELAGNSSSDFAEVLAWVNSKFDRVLCLPAMRAIFGAVDRKSVV